MLPEHLPCSEQGKDRIIFTSLLKHSIVKVCTLKVSFLGLTLQVSMDFCYYVFFILGISQKFRQGPQKKIFSCICVTTSSVCIHFYIHFRHIITITYFCHSSTTIHIHLTVLQTFYINWDVIFLS